MPRVIDDAQILDLLSEEKLLPANWESRLKPIQKANQVFKQRGFDLAGSKGHSFRVAVRHNELIPLDFSVILIFVDTDGSNFSSLKRSRI